MVFPPISILPGAGFPSGEELRDRINLSIPIYHSKETGPLRSLSQECALVYLQEEATGLTLCFRTSWLTLLSTASFSSFCSWGDSCEHSPEKVHRGCQSHQLLRSFLPWSPLLSQRQGLSFFPS